MEQHPTNPTPVAFVAFVPTTPGTLKSGSWGVLSVTATISAQAFNVILSSQFAGGLTAAQAEDLHVVPCIHEIFAGYTITPIANGFNIDFGSAMVRTITIAVSKLVTE